MSDRWTKTEQRVRDIWVKRTQGKASDKELFEFNTLRQRLCRCRECIERRQNLMEINRIRAIKQNFQIARLKLRQSK